MDEKELYNYAIEEIRFREFPQLKDVTYLDHAGATLYAKSQIEAFQRDVTANLYGNPHSACASSKLTSDCIDLVRFRLLKWFNTSADEYSVIFTSGCTGALKLVAESFAFSKQPPQEERGLGDGIKSDASCGESKSSEQQQQQQPQQQQQRHDGKTAAKTSSKKNFVPLGSKRDEDKAGYFCYLQDNHTSVQGMRELTADVCRAVLCITEEELQHGLTDMSVVSGRVAKLGNLGHDKTGEQQRENCLFVFPGQSNFSGRKYPLQWIEEAQRGDLTFQRDLGCRWFVLLDAASLAATSQLDLSSFKPDFLSLSFYKIFGFPTGLGALLVRTQSSWVLDKRYYGGGTVAASTARERFCVLRPNISDRFEDGTLPYLDIIALRHGMDTIDTLAGGMKQISCHTFLIAQYFAQTLAQLRHSNGRPLSEVYCEGNFNSRATQGAIVNFSLKRANGDSIGFAEVDKLAQLHDIHVRTGCFCNIGACQHFLHIQSQTIRDNLDAGHVCGDDKDLIEGRPTGSVRVSFGYMSTVDDATRCLHFLIRCFLSVDSSNRTPAITAPPWFQPQMCTDEQKIAVTSSTDRKMRDFPQISQPDKGGNTILKGEAPVIKAEAPVIKREAPVIKGDDPVSMGGDGNTKVDWKEEEQEVTCSEKRRKLTDICLYPLKSCGAYKVREWEVGSRGLRYDRMWMVVGESGLPLSQKREPRLCLLRPFIHLDTHTLQLTFPGTSPFNLPLDVSSDEGGVNDVNVCTKKVCNDRVTTVDCGDDVAQWLSEAFERSDLRLLRQLDDDRRESRRKDLTDGGEGSGNRLSLANESQLLVISRESVRSLQKKLTERQEEEHSNSKDDVTDQQSYVIDEDGLVDRFRANLVVDGGVAFDEDSWLSLRCGDVLLTGQGQCSRCGMICLDQTTGERTREPLRTLASWRGGKVFFGVYMRVNRDLAKSVLRVGSDVTVF